MGAEEQETQQVYEQTSSDAFELSIDAAISLSGFPILKMAHKTTEQGAGIFMTALTTIEQVAGDSTQRIADFVRRHITRP